MKVLHISGAKGWGGNEQQLVDLIPELSKLDVENIVFGVEGSLLQKECTKKNVNFITSKDKKLNKFVNYKYLKVLVKELKPDLIHLHTSDSLTVFTISDLLFKLKTKAVFSKKGIGSSSSVLSKFKYNYSGINSIICVSKAVQKDFSRILYPRNISKTTVIHDCVSLEILDKKEELNIRENLKIDKNKFIIGNIANHTSAKNIETFINVANHFVNIMNRKDTVFVQVGEYSKLTDAFIESINKKGLSENLFFTGKINNASSINRQFDLFMLTSEREGGPTSVLEAMLFGVPVVSTEVGLISEVIINGENGFYVPVKNEVLLAEKASYLLSDKKLQDQFSAINLEKVKHEFLAPYIAKSTFIEYSKILKS
jgi:L-malate glycosyltransferase